MKPTKPKKAFSFVELAIVIVIISIIIATSIGVSNTITNDSKAKITKDRIAVVYQAITNFVANNKRLPCPSMLNIVKGGDSGTTTTPNGIVYGEETGTVATPKVIGTGVCGQAFASSTANTNLAYGGVPTLALGLDRDMAEDGFGTKFSYVVDRRFTRANIGVSDTLDGFELTQSMPSEAQAANFDLSGIAVRDNTTNNQNLLLARNGIMVLISHGANKFGGFNATGVSQNSLSTITEENENSCNLCSNTASASGYDVIFHAGSTNINFDDIIIFKTKAQLVKDAGLESIMCNGFEAATATYNWGSALANLKNGSYGCVVSSNAASNLCETKVCGKYGVWNRATGTPSAANCGLTCS